MKRSTMLEKILWTACGEVLLSSVFLTPEASASRLVVPLHRQGEILIVDDKRLKPNQVVSGLPHVHLSATDRRFTIVAVEDRAEAGGILAAVIDSREGKVVRQISLPALASHIAVSDDGLYAAVTHPDLRAISILDIRKGKLLKTVSLDIAPSHLTFDRKAGELFVSDADGGRLARVPVKKAGQTRFIEAAGATGHLLVSKDNKFLYAANESSGTVRKISLESERTVKEYALGGEIHGIDVSPDETTLYAADFGGGRLVALNLSDGSTRAVRIEPAPYHLTALTDTKQIIVTSAEQDLIWSVDAARIELTGRYPMQSEVEQIPEIEAVP